MYLVKLYASDLFDGRGGRIRLIKDVPAKPGCDSGFGRVDHEGILLEQLDVLVNDSIIIGRFLDHLYERCKEEHTDIKDNKKCNTPAKACIVLVLALICDAHRDRHSIVLSDAFSTTQHIFYLILL